MHAVPTERSHQCWHIWISGMCSCNVLVSCKFLIFFSTEVSDCASLCVERAV